MIMRVFSRIALVSLLACAAVSAGPITFLFNGIVTQVPIDDIYLDIVPGQPFQGSYTFESTSSDQIPGDPATASYLSTGVPFLMTLSLAGHTFTAADSVSIGVFNTFIDQYTVFALGSGGGLTLEIFLQDNSATAFANDSLPLALLLSSFPTADFHLHEVAAGGEVQVDGQITSLTTGRSDVPEPSTAFTLCGGAFAVWALSRRRQ